MIQIIQRARSEHSVLEVFGRDVVMTQMQYRDSNKPVVNAGPGIPKPLSKSGIHDQVGYLMVKVGLRKGFPLMYYTCGGSRRLLFKIRPQWSEISVLGKPDLFSNFDFKSMARIHRVME